MMDIIHRLGWWGAKARPPRNMPTLPEDCRDGADEIRRLRQELETCAWAAEELDEAWAASPYPDNRKHLSMAEQMSSLDTELEGLRDENSRLRATIADMEMDGPKRDLEKSNDAQAARAMARNTKNAFVAYQNAVRLVLDQMDKLGRQNHVTKEDLRKLRQLRQDLSALLGRSL